MPPLSLAAFLIVACGAEADVLHLCCGIRGEYRNGKDRAEALLAQEEGCAPSSEYSFASMCVSAHAKYTCTRVLYPLVPRCSQRSRTRVHVYPRFVPACSPLFPAFQNAGTRVPAFCTRLFPVVPNVLECGYTCTRVLYLLVPRVPQRSARILCRVQAKFSAQWRSALAARTQWRTHADAEPPAEPEVGASNAG